jgi:S1-C subfamily serine protease
LEGTVSTGVISAKRAGSQMEVLQITAPISPGSSGGALLNSKGEVVGVPYVQMVSGQNLNFAVPVAYVLPLITDSPAKPFPGVPQPVAAKKPAPKRPLQPPTGQPPPIVKTAALDPSELNGTYTGVWQSTVYAVSGAAVMTISTQGKTVHAEIALTGGQVTRDTMTGEVSEVGGGWSVTLRNAAGNLYTTGIFKKGVFEGDYDYVSASDHGRWGLKKD